MTTTDPTPASMGGPLSEAERAGANYKHRPVADGGPIRDDRLDEIREEAGYANVTVDADELLWLLNERDRLESDNEELTFKWASLSEERIRRENAEKAMGVLEGQLATARALHQPLVVDWSTSQKCKASHGVAWVNWPCPDAIALGLDGGDPDE